MIVVATDDFEVYHGVVRELRRRGVEFTTIEVTDPLPDGCEVLITADSDASTWADCPVPVVHAQAVAPRDAVDAALEVLRGGGGQRIVGVDPGTRPGIAVLSGPDVVAVFQVPLAEVAAVVQDEIQDAIDPIVRVGNGARLSGMRLIEELHDVRVELVDETGTTPHLGQGARGMGDVLAAVNIARRDGEVVESRDVEPTQGEIQAVKNRSREQSGSATLPQELARQVATGELTMEEALAQHTTEPDDSDPGS